MEAHEIIYATKGRKEAEAWSRIDGRSAKLFESYSYAPRSPENPLGSGNYSPVYHYLHFLAQRAATNRDGAIRMHQLVNDEAKEIFEGSADAAEVRPAGIEILRKAVEVVGLTGDTDIQTADWSDLCALDDLLARLAGGVESLRTVVRVAKRRKELPPRERAFVNLS